MAKSRRIKITHIHEEDAHYPSKYKYIGLEGDFTPRPPHRYKGYYEGNLLYESGNLFFLGVRYKRI